jgi:hypothetical protein
LRGPIGKKSRESESLALQTNPEPELLTIDKLKRVIADRATGMSLDYHWSDICAVTDHGYLFVFLQRCNPRLREIEIDGFPTVGVDKDGNPIVDWTYPLYIEYGSSASIGHRDPRTVHSEDASRVMSMCVQGRVALRIPRLVIAVLPDGTIKDGMDEEVMGALEARRREYFHKAVLMAERSVRNHTMRIRPTYDR